MRRQIEAKKAAMALGKVTEVRSSAEQSDIGSNRAMDVRQSKTTLRGSQENPIPEVDEEDYQPALGRQP